MSGRKRRKLAAAIAGLSITLFGVSVLQDYLDARFGDYSFYLSESVLFGIVWLLFFALAPLQLRILARGQGRWRVIRGLAVVAGAAFIHLAIYAGLVHLTSRLLMAHTFGLSGVLEYGLSNFLVICLIVYALVAGMYHMMSRRPTKGNERPVITIKTGGRTEIIAVESISHLTVDRPYVAVHTDGKILLASESLKAFAGKLEAYGFVRIHRSAIVRCDRVTACISRANGDYDLRLSNGTELRLSRIFRKRFFAAMESKSARPAKSSA